MTQFATYHLSKAMAEGGSPVTIEWYLDGARQIARQCMVTDFLRNGCNSHDRAEIVVELHERDGGGDLHITVQDIVTVGGNQCAQMMPEFGMRADYCECGDLVTVFSQDEDRHYIWAGRYDGSKSNLGYCPKRNGRAEAIRRCRAELGTGLALAYNERLDKLIAV